jgi:hypothetical protein
MVLLVWLCFGSEAAAFMARGCSYTDISWSSMITFEDKSLGASLQPVSGVLCVVEGQVVERGWEVSDGG